MYNSAVHTFFHASMRPYSQSLLAPQGIQTLCCTLPQQCTVGSALQLPSSFCLPSSCSLPLRARSPQQVGTFVSVLATPVNRCFSSLIADFCRYCSASRGTFLIWGGVRGPSALASLYGSMKIISASKLEHPDPEVGEHKRKIALADVNAFINGNDEVCQ